MPLAMIGHQVPGKGRTREYRGVQASSEPASDVMISQLFRAYFNNKMTLLIFLIQAKTVRPASRTVEGILRFLDDLYHHMLTGEAQEQYHHAIERLKSFFQDLPDVSPEQRDRARGSVRGLYQALGMNLKADI